MSTVEQYAASTVEKYHVAADTESTSHRAADEVIPLIKQWGKQYLQDIKLSGAYAKNTAISLSSDVDVLITLNPVTGKDIKNIFWSLFEYLSDHDLRPESRRVSIQVQALKMKVDLIPSYRDRGGSVPFKKKTGAEIQTDLNQHIHLVGSSGRQQEICALKIWASETSSSSLRSTLSSPCLRRSSLSPTVNSCTTSSLRCAISETASKRPSWYAIRRMRIT
jgi:hypothetical protein